MTRLIKVCGVKTDEAAIAAAAAGANLLGFVFFQKSPRYVSPEAAEEIVTEVKRASEEMGFGLPKFAGLFVDAGESLLAETAPFLTHFQFHGHEDAERCTEIGAEFAVEIIRAFAIAGPDDLAAAAGFGDAADMFLFDARAPAGADRPGGHGAPFDWSLLKAYAGETPFLLAGGLDADNVAAAIKAASVSPAFAGVDVSSGIELRPGEKDLEKIAAFIKAARAAG